MAGTSPTATGRCLNKGALVANPVCRFTSSLIPSNRSRLSPALGRVRAAVSASGVHLDGARQGSNTNTSRGRIIKEPVVNEHLLQPSRGCRAPVIWAPGLSECRCTDPRAPGVLQSSPSIAPPGCSGGAAGPPAPPQPLHGGRDIKQPGGCRFSAIFLLRGSAARQELRKRDAGAAGSVLPRASLLASPTCVF